MVVTSDRCKKVTKTIPTTKTNVTIVSHIFFGHFVANYVITSKPPDNNVPQFVSKFLAAVCSSFQMNNVTTTEYHAQTNGHAENFNFTLISCLRHYITEHQTDCDTYLLPLGYAYNVQVHVSMEVSPFSLAHTRPRSGPFTVLPKRVCLALDDDPATPMYTG